MINLLRTKSNITLAVVVGILSIFASSNVVGQKTNFSGVWKINEKKSDFAGQDVSVMYKKLKVNQTSDSLTIGGYRYSTDNNMPISTFTSYGLDGKRIMMGLPNKRTMTAFLQWGADNKSLIRNSSYSFPNNPNEEDFKSSEIWSLSADGKELTLTRTFIMSSGNTTVKALYDWQED